MEIASRNGMAWFWVGLLFVAAQFADAITTVASLSLGGVESNPLVLGLIAQAGIAGYVSVKLSAMAVGVGLLLLANRLRWLLPDVIAQRVALFLFVGLQVGAAVQVLAVTANLVALGSEMRF